MADIDYLSCECIRCKCDLQREGVFLMLTRNVGHVDFQSNGDTVERITETEEVFSVCPDCCTPKRLREVLRPVGIQLEEFKLSRRPRVCARCDVGPVLQDQAHVSYHADMVKFDEAGDVETIERVALSCVCNECEAAEATSSASVCGGQIQ